MLNTVLDILQTLPRVAIIMAVLFAPIVTMEMLRAEPSGMFESSSRNSGAGLVLMISLQR